jgi:hypothetical protein
MKRLISAALIASTLALTVGATAASAQPYGRHGGYGYSRGWNGGYRHHDNTGALVGLGIGLFALGAIAAASANHDRYYDRYDYGPPPPPPPAYRYGYGSYGYRY